MPDDPVHRFKASGQMVALLKDPGLDTGAILRLAPLYLAGPGLPMGIVSPKVEVDVAECLTAIYILSQASQSAVGSLETFLEDHEYAAS